MGEAYYCKECISLKNKDLEGVEMMEKEKTVARNCENCEFNFKMYVLDMENAQIIMNILMVCQWI